MYVQVSDCEERHKASSQLGLDAFLMQAGKNQTLCFRSEIDAWVVCVSVCVCVCVCVLQREIMCVQACMHVLAAYL